MKVLVATGRTQGARDNDYHHAIEGELVRIDPPCRKDRDDPDGRCGCGRGFAGMNSQRATTTARVAEVPLTREEYAEALRSSLEHDGYEPCTCRSTDEADALAELAATWPVGAVIERRLDELARRVSPEEVPA
ncbi:DUF7715 family protein [Actinomycetospora termitidis]|uniref:DUF7715 domain-containing protein n=1 Tax=Actinomycetospora termitidis TaxID=3053470 RepID=A0ABT7MBS4_9PSEU|nr:hypothetical protein [Actinomycetospora sp. Odt1-22]MDL5158116.1 hypothetical protein [Actinomycetospora sp. Odt1-22]